MLGHHPGARVSLAISTTGLTMCYGGKTVLKSLDLKVPKNSILGFLGPNGAGKTTTIKLLLGLSPPTSGGATVFGRDILTDSIEVRKRVGYLNQDPRYYDNLTARQTLRFRASLYFSGPKDEIEKQIEEKLELVGISDRADRPIKGFSGGERQRLGIALALINSPELLILDEPAASLDPMGRRDVLDIMKKMKKDTTIFYSTHIIDDVQRVSDTVVILNQGELIAQGPIEELMKGKGGTFFTLRFRGNATDADSKLSTQPWVIGIEKATSDRDNIWNVKVNDEKTAEESLVGLVQSKDTPVLQFGKKTHSLEEIFMGLVEGDKNE